MQGIDIDIRSADADASVGEDRSVERGSGAAAAAHTLESYVEQY